MLERLFERNRVSCEPKDSLQIMAAAIKAFRESGAGEAFVQQSGDCTLSALGSSLYVSGTPSAATLRKAAKLTETLASPAVISDSKISLEGYTPRDMWEMVFEGQARPAVLASDIVEPVKVINRVFSLSADRLLFGYLKRTAAGISALYAADADGMTVAAAAADFICGDSCVIGSVCVRREYRGHNLGFALAASVAAAYKRAYLICEPSLAPCYERVGFRKTKKLTMNVRNS